MRRRGFTLVEVMMATAVLALGTVMVYEGFFVSLNLYKQYSGYLKVSALMDEKISAAQIAINRYGSLGGEDSSGELERIFSWSLAYSLAGESKDMSLYKIDMIIAPAKKGENPEFRKTAYAFYVKKK